MQLIIDLDVMNFWHGLASDDAGLPFEQVAKERFACFSATGFSFMFNKIVIEALCKWSVQCGESDLAAFFTAPSVADFFSQAGFYGGMTFNAHDDPEAVEEMLFADQASSPFFSIYEASSRMFVLPSDGRWALIGQRDADLVLFCFKSEPDREAFFRLSSFETFDSISDAARFAQSTMGYDFDFNAR